MTGRRELAARREALVARSEWQRRQATVVVAEIAWALRPVAAAGLLVRRAADHPIWVAGAIVMLVVVVRPGRLWNFAAWAVSAVLAARRFVRPWHGLETKRPAVL